MTTLTKRMAEDLTDYLRELGVKVQYLHCEVDTLERVKILRDLRLGVFDVIVGINLLREGIDLPEVTLVAILDADKEGFLRSAWSLIQMIGRAARNIGGEVVMYADIITESMRAAIDETNRRRGDPGEYNRSTGSRRSRSSRRSATSTTGCGSRPRRGVVRERDGRGRDLAGATKTQVEQLVARMEAEMRTAARELEFERAAALRDEIQQIRLRVLDEDASVIVGRAAEAAAAPIRGAGGGRPARRAARGTSTGTTMAPVARGHRGRGRCPRARSRRSPRGPRPTGCRGCATSTTTRTRRAGRRAGSTGRRGTGR